MGSIASTMGDTEFDSFFDEPAPAGDAPVEAASEPAADCDGGFDGGFDAPADAPVTEEAQDFGGGFDAPADAPMADMSNAFTTTQNLASDSPALQAWRAENETKLAGRAKKSNEDMAALLETAKEDRATFYEQRKIQTDAAAKSNRDDEALSKEASDALAQKDNLWESVGDMIDLQNLASDSPALQAWRAENAFTTTQNLAKGDGKDVARMRSVMISMKNA